MREVQPKNLFLFQDGPRNGHPEDMEKILKCREIVNNIDWNTTVHQRYEKENHGPDEAGYLADKWAFESAEECIVLEDDMVPSKSFFFFCQDMLEKYRYSNRVMLISGFNPTETYNHCNSDYFFTAATITYGWATWKRVIDEWDGTYSFLDDRDKVNQIEKYVSLHGLQKNYLRIIQSHRQSGIPHWETVLISNQYLNNGLSLMPRKNMVSNIGITEGASHYASDLNLIPKGIRKIFTMDQFDLDVENLKDPEKIEDDPEFAKEVYRIYGWGHPWVKAYRFIESSIYQLKAGNVKYVINDFKSKVYNVIHHYNT